METGMGNLAAKFNDVITKNGEVKMCQVKTYDTLWAKNLDDEVLTKFWDQICAEGVARMTFYEYMPKDSEEFCSWAKGDAQDVRFIINTENRSDVENHTGTNNSENKILAMYWLNNILGKAAMIHFCYIRAAFCEHIEIGEYVVRSLLLTKNEDDDFVVSALMGLTPKVYRHALGFVENLGFSILGVLPKSCLFSEKNSYKDGVISVLTRENIMRKNTE